MPELPDVEVMKRYIDSTALHSKVEHVTVTDDKVLEVSPSTLRRHIESKPLEETERRGKHLFLSTGGGQWLMLHFGMTGDVDYSGDNETPEHALVQFHFNNNGTLSYLCRRKLGTVDITDGPDAFSEEHDVGKDALDIGREHFRLLLEEKSGMIKTALMDQSAIAGIGNVYSDEILYQCHLHPETKVSDLNEDRLDELHRSMQRILKTAINNGAEPGQMPDHYLIGHRDKEADCPDCGGGVKRIEVSGRGCYLCPNCQQK